MRSFAFARRSVRPGFVLTILGSSILTLAACGGGGDDWTAQSAAPATSPTPVTAAPTTTAPAETVVPVATAPVAAPAPVATSVPVTTSAPVATPAPVGTFTPIVTFAPVATPAPVETSASVAPSVSAAPAAPAPAITDAAPPTQSAPVATVTISGAPVTSTTPDLYYSFTPTAATTGTDGLTFNVANKPGWALFDSSDGRLRGQPRAADIGAYKNIVISVTDGKQTASLRAFDVAVVASALGSITVTLNPPLERTDGTALPNLGGYKIYYGTRAGEYTNSVTISNAGTTTHMIERLTPATYFLVATSFDSQGMESAHSNVASKVVR